jgi:SAM-dependent methyltransferase
MVDFKIDEKFDVILCVFDSINHILDFEDWKKLFMNVRNHLSSNGVFIFDINTQEKLIRTIKESPWVKPFEENIMIMDVVDGGNEVSNWNIKIFQKKENNMYELHEENIREISFPMEKIENELKYIYTEVVIQDKIRKSPETAADSVYFICS